MVLPLVIPGADGRRHVCDVQQQQLGCRNNRDGVLVFLRWPDLTGEKLDGSNSIDRRPNENSEEHGRAM